MLLVKRRGIGEGIRRTEFEGVDSFGSDVRGIGLACEFGCEGHCDCFERGESEILDINGMFEDRKEFN